MKHILTRLLAGIYATPIMWVLMSLGILCILAGILVGLTNILEDLNNDTAAAPSTRHVAHCIPNPVHYKGWPKADRLMLCMINDGAEMIIGDEGSTIEYKVIGI